MTDCAALRPFGPEWVETCNRLFVQDNWPFALLALFLAFILFREALQDFPKWALETLVDIISTPFLLAHDIYHGLRTAAREERPRQTRIPFLHPCPNPPLEPGNNILATSPSTPPDTLHTGYPVHTLETPATTERNHTVETTHRGHTGPGT